MRDSQGKNGHHVADTGFRQDVPRGRRVILYLLAKTTHVDSEHFGLVDIFWSPDEFEQLLLDQHLAGMGSEVE